MGLYDDLVDSLVKKNNEANVMEDGDYLDDEGLICCGKCHTRKQTRVTILGREIKPMVPCECRQAEIDREEEEEKRQQKEFELANLQRACFHDDAMKECTFENDDGKNPRIINIAKRYAEKFRQMKDEHKGLLFFGGVGVGKTYAAVCIANALMKRGIPCMVTNFPRLINTLEGLRDKRQEFLDNMNNYDLLIIDDLASERNTEYMQEFVMQIINTRDRSGLPIIVTTNLTSEELKNPSDMQKQRIYSRLLGMCVPIEVKGSDRRKMALKDDFSKYSDILGLEEP